MVGRLFTASNVLVDLTVLQQVRSLWRQQEVVDADAVVTVPGARLIIPERIVTRAPRPGAKGFGEPKVYDALKGGAAFGAM